MAPKTVPKKAGKSPAQVEREREEAEALAAALPGARVIVHEVDWGSFPFVPELGGLLTCPYYVLVLQKGPVSA